MAQANLPLQKNPTIPSYSFLIEAKGEHGRTTIAKQMRDHCSGNWGAMEIDPPSKFYKLSAHMIPT